MILYIFYSFALDKLRGGGYNRNIINIMQYYRIFEMFIF